jgi:hypothetical protein
MTWNDWFKLFRRTSDDAHLRQVLIAEGFPPVPPVPRDESDVRIEKGGLMLEFLDVALYPSLGRGLGAGHGILSAMTFVVSEPGRESWTGELPFGLEPQASQAGLRARFGDPVDENDTFDWDMWKLDGLDVTVTFKPDRSSISLITVEALDRGGEPT